MNLFSHLVMATFLPFCDPPPALGRILKACANAHSTLLTVRDVRPVRAVLDDVVASWAAWSVSELVDVLGSDIHLPERLRTLIHGDRILSKNRLTECCIVRR